MIERGPRQGVLAIARFNWPFYAAAAAVVIGCLSGFLIFESFPIRLGLAVAGLGAGYFLIVSLVVSHLIYDRSDLYLWKWLTRAIDGLNPRQVIVCHSGFDEVSDALRHRISDASWLVLDHFDPAQMTEPSIRRARALFPPTPGTISAPHDRWPAEAMGADLVLGILAIHEFRSAPERTAWFSEAARSLNANGRIILVEHLRDAANFVAFGPGFLHFHSRNSWQHSWRGAGLKVVDEFRITPWIAVFVLVKS